MKSGFTMVSDKMAQVRKGIALVTRSDVLVGVPNTRANRSGEINNAALAYIHDNGAPEAGIPARPFMDPGIQDAKKDIGERFKNIGKDALAGRPEAVTRGLTGVGLVAASSVKSKINSNIPPPLKPGTLAARRRRGASRTNTLVDTGQMRNSITHVVREKKK